MKINFKYGVKISLTNISFYFMQIPIALDMAKASYGKDSELMKRIVNDTYMSCAVRESYASFKNIIKFLVGGQREKQ